MSEHIPSDDDDSSSAVELPRQPDRAPSPLLAAIEAARKAEQDARAAAEKAHKAAEEDDDEDEADEKPKKQVEASANDQEMAEIAETAQLSEEEKKAALKAKLAAPNIESPDAPAEIAQAPETAAVEDFHEKLGEKLEDPTKSAEQSINEAADETMAEMETATAETAAPDDEDDPLTATPTSPLPSTSTPPPTPSSSSAGPRGPSGPTGPGPVPPFYPGGPAYNVAPTAPTTPNVAPTATGPTPEDLREAERRGQIRGVVAGGIVGYLVGRRRGRIKTERQLLPVQERLQKQVEDLYQEVDVKEEQIRRLSREKTEANASDNAAQQAVAESLQPQVPVVEGQPVAIQPEAIENILVQPVLQAAEQAAPAHSQPVEKVPDLFQGAESTLPAKHIENVNHMDHRELLRTSDKVVIEGMSLRTIFEANQITETGLKHILAEFLSGGDVKHALDEELKVKQQTYERDPDVRSSASAAVASAQVSGARSNPTDEQQAPIQEKHIVPQTAALPTITPMPEQSDIPNQSVSAAKRMEHMIVGGWLLLIAVLIIVILVLLGHRG